MNKLERLLNIVLQAALTFIALLVCVKLCTGCALIGKAAPREKVVEALKSAYESGGREAVSNRIEKLVADGTLSRKQGEKIHALMQKAYEGLVDNLSRRIEEAAVNESGEGEDTNCGKCEDCKAK